MERALKEALRININEATGRVDPRLTNNIGMLRYLEGNLDTARTLCESAITHAANADSEIAEGLSTTILYNLARTYEEQGEEGMAKQAYEKLLHRHPEYTDAKIRRAQVLIDVNRRDDARDLLKQALSSQGNDLNLRAYHLSSSSPICRSLPTHSSSLP
ncbi:hypothetical protein WOLCODRAFT_165695 [Wolfiporia cocos MD-104 SS10]|uniref:Uncharacterized protein n=1 Tax=Wolfiporia cocos (strain MD-104) TaxID=742152 RepID=A0A2H3J4A5_WOLCO|nr:hypothetical protein WOLCODRAFT_165695 [Wolfiporia cocos MD-104 SS10]